MSKALIIVESPAKIKTLQKFLGSNYRFESSIGHIRDLPAKEFGIDLEKDFEPKYVTMPDKEAVITKLRKAAKECDIVYLCPDPDREGEAIAWHISQILPAGTKLRRVTFNSITKDSVLKALDSPREIDVAMVNAQQARRLLDRIVGYKISPLLNKRIQRGRASGVSAGRVQSVALKLVVDREKEIEAFKPVEYWNLAALLAVQKTHDSPFRAALYSVDGKRIDKEAAEGKDILLIGNKATADAILKRMKHSPYQVTSVEKKEKRRNPVPPFITSTLQQEASRHFGFSSSRTMSIAQSLYEGVDLGNEGTEGLITYMRTDSVRIAPEAIQDARRFVTSTFGNDYLPASPKVYASKGSAQDAHEAIRPTNLYHTPDSIRNYLTKDQFNLYQLIWRRFISSQMAPAIYDTVAANIEGEKGIIVRATGSVIKFRGFLAIYEEKKDEKEEEKEDEDRILPPLQEGQLLDLREALAEQAFTRPPPRFTEASLVKELEKSGIGRPSTYATIMNKIQSREYTVKEQSRLKPTELGRVIAQFLEDNFKQIMDIGFTSSMEDDLEKIAEQEKDWKVLMRDFWTQFAPTIEIAEKEAYIPKVMTDLICPTCGSNLQKIWFKNKYFFGCSRYPDCNYSAPVEELEFNKEDYDPDFDWTQHCPKCSKEMKLRFGKFGPFLGCTDYPNCRGIVNIPKKGETALPQQEMPACPAIGCPGQLVARRSRFGKIFYSCSTFPECDVIVNSLEQIETKYVNHPRTAYIAKTKGKAPAKSKAAAAAAEKKEAKAKPKKKAVHPQVKVSSELAAIVGTEGLSRPEITKKLWEYIKGKELQDPANKRRINPDTELAKVFGSSEPVDMMKLPGLVNKHITKE
ncbi:MAG: type I DNA topoisomerase [Parachlamydiales bacterium]|jgi:DNA topoisomerase-1